MFLQNIQNDGCKIYDNAEFGYTAITIEKSKSIESLIADEKLQILKNKDNIPTKKQELETKIQNFTSNKTL